MVEAPFWNEQLGKDSGGKLTGNIKSITEVNLKGTEVLRLLKTGVYDVSVANQHGAVIATFRGRSHRLQGHVVEA